MCRARDILRLSREHCWADSTPPGLISLPCPVPQGLGRLCTGWGDLNVVLVPLPLLVFVRLPYSSWYRPRKCIIYRVEVCKVKQLLLLLLLPLLLLVFGVIVVACCCCCSCCCSCCPESECPCCYDLIFRRSSSKHSCDCYCQLLAVRSFPNSSCCIVRAAWHGQFFWHASF